MNKQAINLTQELCELLEYISDIAIQIRMNSSYRSEYKNLNHYSDAPIKISKILDNVMEYSHVIHEFHVLSNAIKSNNFHETVKECGFQVKRCEALKAYLKNNDVENSESIINIVDRGIAIFESIIFKTKQALN
ncbi:hypothetical protein fh0823_23530 [Francisella halioticida]|uniref:hypothetical protein n=1 Tax=Francisella halioticida TaxID=549298 RepID=UPI001AF6D5B8|nr:hypothetical protein [Francisella halioticida]BCD92214.1 hypothetical protein fh0823_23530 [Francisella halioticida]